MSFKEFLLEQNASAPYHVGDTAFVYHLKDDKTGDFYKALRVDSVDGSGFYVKDGEDHIYFKSSTLKSIDPKNKENSNKFVLGEKP